MNSQKTAGWGVFLALIIILMLPHLIFVLLPSSSLAVGVALSSLLICFLGMLFPNRLIFGRTYLIAALGCFFMLGAFALAPALDGYNKPIFSALLLLYVAFACFLVSQILCSYETPAVESAFLWTLLFVLFLGWMDLLFEFDFGNYANYPKAVFPFSEESHYALTVGILGCAGGVNRSGRFKIFVVSNIFMQAVLFPNLTLLVFFFVLGFVYWGRGKVYLCLLTIPPLMLCSWWAVELFGGELIAGYFGSRLDLSSETKNLTALVYQQGWLDAWNSLLETAGFGLGFQMLGTNQPNEVSVRIMYLFGKEFNREDGGFLAAKIISEFGVFGVFLVLAYLYFILSYALLGRRKTSQNNMDSLLSACIFGFLVEFFFRGYGYFSPGLVLVASCVMAKASKKYASEGA